MEHIEEVSMLHFRGIRRRRRHLKLPFRASHRVYLKSSSMPLRIGTLHRDRLQQDLRLLDLLKQFCLSVICGLLQHLIIQIDLCRLISRAHCSCYVQISIRVDRCTCRRILRNVNTQLIRCISLCIGHLIFLIQKQRHRQFLVLANALHGNACEDFAYLQVDRRKHLILHH